MSESAKQANVRILKRMEKIIQEELGLDEIPGLTVMIVQPPQYDRANWISNLSRADTLKIMQKLTARMIAEQN